MRDPQCGCTDVVERNANENVNLYVRDQDLFLPTR